MSSICIRGARVVFPGDRIEVGNVCVAEGRIACIGPVPYDPLLPSLEANGRLLSPGLIDMHTHGIEHFIFENGALDMREGIARLPAYGVTTVFPTLVPRPCSEGLNALRRCVDAIEGARGAWVPGVHLEGPFMAVSGASSETLHGDRGLLDELIDACRERVSVMSLSPDTPGILPVIERLRERNVRVFLTHTRADVSQTLAAIDAGARHATHFYDVFPVPVERDSGVRPAGAVEVCLEDPRVTVDFIADGVHVDPVVIRMSLRAKGPSGVALVTDSSIGAGLPPGEYPTPWGYPVKVETGRGVRISDPGHHLHGCLAGSSLTMNVGMAHLLSWVDLPRESIWAMGTLNPARIVGLECSGRMAEGARADLVLWNDDLTPAAVWVGGESRGPSSMPGVPSEREME